MNLNSSCFNYWFKKFIKDNDIKDANGDYYNLTSHQFRRTLGTDMLSKALADNVEWHLKYDHDEMPHHTEGYESAQWMLLDYGCAVLHVFMPEARKFYNLENLWKDGTPVTLEELGIEDK